MSESGKLSNRQIDALPMRAWLRYRFGVGHRLTLAWLGVALALWVTNFDLATASNGMQLFVLLVMVPMGMAAILYGGDAAVAVGYRLGLTSHRSLYPKNIGIGDRSWKEVGELLQAEASAEEAAAVAAEQRRAPTPNARRSMYDVESSAGLGVAAEAMAEGPRGAPAAAHEPASATDARKLLYVVGVPSGMVIAVGIIVMTGGYGGGEVWLIIGILGLLVAVAPTFAEWRRSAAEPVTDITVLDARLATASISDPAPEDDSAQPGPEPARPDEP